MLRDSYATSSEVMAFVECIDDVNDANATNAINANVTLVVRLWREGGAFRALRLEGSGQV
jgi:hypothetical protein